MIISLRGRQEVASMGGGVVGQISFTRLIEMFRKAGELKADETITHLDIKLREGVIQYRVESTP